MIQRTTKFGFTFVLAALLSACSGDDSTTINIEQPSNDGGSSGGGDSSGGDSGGDSGGETPAECPEGTTEVSEGLCELPATIGSDMTLSAGVKYLMSERVTLGNGNGQLETNHYIVRWVVDYFDICVKKIVNFYLYVEKT